MSAFEGDVTLYYYEAFEGRSMPIRMILTDAGVPFTVKPPSFGGETRVIPDNDGNPVFAPPAVKIPGEGNVSQTYAIMQYLAEKLGYKNEDNDTPMGRALVAQLTLDALDIMSESYNCVSSRDEAKIEEFTSDDGRLHKWLTHVNQVLKTHGSTGAGRKRQHAFKSDKPTTADFAIFSAFKFSRFMFGKEKTNIKKYKRVRGLLQKMRMRENFKPPGRALPWSMSHKGRQGMEDPGVDSDSDNDGDDDDEDD